jgi:hypothetical protein
MQEGNSTRPNTATLTKTRQWHRDFQEAFRMVAKIADATGQAYEDKLVRDQENRRFM